MGAGLPYGRKRGRAGSDDVGRRYISACRHGLADVSQVSGSGSHDRDCHTEFEITDEVWNTELEDRRHKRVLAGWCCLTPGRGLCVLAEGLHFVDLR